MKGILFKPWKADAIRMSGTDRLWQTRRTLKPQPDAHEELHLYCSRWDNNGRATEVASPVVSDRHWRPRYKAGEVVYVKERWDPAVWPAWALSRWKSPMFMPAIAARMHLLITNVRVERTRGISWQDCIAEGVVQSPQWGQMQDFTGPGHEGYLSPEEAEKDLDKCWEAYVREAFWKLYDSINGAGAHERNWDWVYEFRRED